MSQFYSKIDHYKNVMATLGIDCDPQLLTAVTKGLGPSIYKEDSETISGSCEAELVTVKNSFLNKKLGIYDVTRYDDAIKSVCKKMGSTNNKYRAIFYYLLVKEFRREYVYELN